MIFKNLMFSFILRTFLIRSAECSQTQRFETVGSLLAVKSRLQKMTDEELISTKVIPKQTTTIISQEGIVTKDIPSTVLTKSKLIESIQLSTHQDVPDETFSKNIITEQTSQESNNSSPEEEVMESYFHESLRKVIPNYYARKFLEYMTLVLQKCWLMDENFLIEKMPGKLNP